MKKAWYGLKNNWLQIFILLLLGFAIGFITRSWKGIKWSDIQYGTIPDWISGICAAIAIIGSIIFFAFGNKAKLNMMVLRNDEGKELELRVSNDGRRTGSFKLVGFKEHPKVSSEEKPFLLVGPADKDKFIYVEPGKISDPMLFHPENMSMVIKGEINDKDTYDIDFAIMDGNWDTHELTISLKDGKFFNERNDRINAD